MERIEAAAQKLDAPAIAAKARAFVASCNRDDLDFRYRASIGDGRELPAAFLLLSERYTALGIPPALRPWPDDMVGQVQRGDIPRELLVIADLMWLFSHYPEHKPAVEGWTRHFRNQARHYDAMKLVRKFRGGGVLAKRLNLTSAMKAESMTLRHGGTTWITPYLAREASALEALEREQRRRDGRQTMRGQHHRKGDHQRRFQVWQCGQRCECSPTLTARLYSAMTGKAMTRQLAAKLIGEAHIDIRNFERRKSASD